MPDVNALIPALRTAASSDSVSAVVLDYGNVLYAWEPIAAVAGYVSADAWEEFVVDGGFLSWNERLDRGEPFDQVLTDYARAHPDRPDWAEILSLYRERFAASLTGPVPGMAARLLVPQLERFVGVVVSGREHLTKPDPAAFELLLSRYRLQAPSTLFIDDSPVNIEAAGRLGLRTHRFTGSGRLRSELIALGLLPTPGRH